VIGAVANPEGRAAIIAMAEHGARFVGKGKHEDEFTHYLVLLFKEFFKSHDRYPRNKEVVALLESQEHQGFINTINDDVIEWGDHGASTKLTTLPNRLTKIREFLGIKNHDNR
jgi:hypothetical protein